MTEDERLRYFMKQLAFCICVGLLFLGIGGFQQVEDSRLWATGVVLWIAHPFPGVIP